MFKQKNVLISLAVAAMLAACGGGGGGSETSLTPDSGTGSNNGGNTPGGGSNTPGGGSGSGSTTSGKVVDGYLAGSVVVCDTNNNGTHDANEAVALTDNQGGFTFAAACSAPIFAIGGTDTGTTLPFRGQLKASAGSTVVTPLTSLMTNANLTNAAIVASLGLTGGIDVTKTDPAAGTASAPTNGALYNRTLAVQQILQQTADAVAALTNQRTTSQTQAIYAEVAKAAGAALAAAPSAQLIDASGAVNAAVVSDIIQRTVAGVAAADQFNGASVAAVIAPAIAAEAQALVRATDADRATVARAMAADTSVVDTVRQIPALLTKANASNVGAAGLTNAGNSLVAYVGATSASAKTEAATTMAAALDAEAAKVSAGAFDTTLLNKPSNFLELVANLVKINGHEGYGVDQFASEGSIATATATPTFRTLELDFDPNGMAPSTGSNTIPVSIGFELIGEGATGQAFQMMIDRADLSVSSTNAVSVSIPATAKVYAFGRNAAGQVSNVTLDTVPASALTAGANPAGGSAVTLNVGAVLQALSANNAVFTELNDVRGKFNVKAVFSNVDLRKEIIRTPVNGLSLNVTGANQTPVTGAGVQGKIEFINP